jgi:hypothetical protein
MVAALRAASLSDSVFRVPARSIVARGAAAHTVTPTRRSNEPTPYPGCVCQGEVALKASRF